MTTDENGLTRQTVSRRACPLNPPLSVVIRWHTSQDTIDQARAEWLGEAGRVAMKVVEKVEAGASQ